MLLNSPMKLTLPAGFGNLDFTDWLRGLVSAFVSGGATGASAAFVGSTLTKDLAVGTSKFFIELLAVFTISGTLSMLNFLRTKPIPDMKIVTTTVQMAQQSLNPPATVVTTIAETHAETTSGEPKA